MAAAQRCLVHVSQLRALGIERGSTYHRLSFGSLHRVLPSALSVVDPVLEPLSAETAALLYAGDDSVLSHRSAAALWGFAAAAPFVAVTVAGRHVRHRSGLRIHRVRALDSRDVRIRNGFPVTAPSRTLIDVAGGARNHDDLERALNEARVLELVSDAELEQAMARCPRRSGVSRVRALMRAEQGPALTRSEAERRLRILVGSGQLPWPSFNVRLAPRLCGGCAVESRPDGGGGRRISRSWSPGGV
jgi:hypothetical protein